MDYLLLLLLQVVLIALNAIFAGAEIAVLSINETKLEKMASEGNGRAKRLFRLVKEPAKFLATIQVAITLSGFLGSAFAADNFSEPLVKLVKSWGIPFSDATLDTIAVVLITIILSYFTLIFGELVPKRLAMKKSESIAMGISGLVSGIYFLFKPIVWLLSLSTNAVLRLFGVDPNETEEDVSEEEIRMLVDAGSEQGAIDHQEKEFIQNVFEFNDITAGNIVKHRTDVTILWTEDDDATWNETILTSRYTRYPVCGETADNVLGVLNAKDYFALQDKTRENVLTNAVHPAYFVPESIKADVLFRNMRETHNSLAVVVDEYGGMEGIVTLYDLIEELVGELNKKESTMQNGETVIEKMTNGSFKLYGNVALRDLEDETGLKLVTEEFDTFTGMIFDALGIIPSDGLCDIKLSLSNMDVVVNCIEEHRIKEATVTVKPAVHLEDMVSTNEKDRT